MFKFKLETKQHARWGFPGEKSDFPLRIFQNPSVEHAFFKNRQRKCRGNGADELTKFDEYWEREGVSESERKKGGGRGGVQEREGEGTRGVHRLGLRRSHAEYS